METRVPPPPPPPPPPPRALTSTATEKDASKTDDWEEQFSKQHNRKYWKNKITGEKTWENPIKGEANKGKAKTDTDKPLKDGQSTSSESKESEESVWEEKYSEKHKKPFWKNKTTGETTWKRQANVDKPKENNESTDAKQDQTILNDNNENGTELDKQSVWEEAYSKKHERKYWRNKLTKETTWTDPNAAKTNPSNQSSKTEAVDKNIEKHVNNQSASDDWDEKYSEKYKKKFWKNKKTGETTWANPMATSTETGKEHGALKGDSKSDSSASKASAAENEWEEKYSEKYKKPFWKNKTTGETTWKKPAMTAIAPTTAIAATNTQQSNAENTNSAVESVVEASENEWEEKYSEKYKKPFWKNKKTAETTWKKPDTAAVNKKENAADDATTSEWEEKFSEKYKKPFWKNTKTGETSWKRPTLMKPAETMAKSSADARDSSPASESKDNEASTPKKGLWEEKFSPKRNKPFWKNTETSETTWNDPNDSKGEDLAGKSAIDSPNAVKAMATDISESRKNSMVNDNPWEEKYSDKYKKPYWKHKKTGETSWKQPKAFESQSSDEKSSTNDDNAATNTLLDESSVSKRNRSISPRNSMIAAARTSSETHRPLSVDSFIDINHIVWLHEGQEKWISYNMSISGQGFQLVVELTPIDSFAVDSPANHDNVTISIFRCKQIVCNEISCQIKLTSAEYIKPMNAKSSSLAAGSSFTSNSVLFPTQRSKAVHSTRQVIRSSITPYTPSKGEENHMFWGSNDVNGSTNGSIQGKVFNIRFVSSATAQRLFYAIQRRLYQIPSNEENEETLLLLQRTKFEDKSSTDAALLLDGPDKGYSRRTYTKTARYKAENISSAMLLSSHAMNKLGLMYKKPFLSLQSTLSKLLEASTDDDAIEAIASTLGLPSSSTISKIMNRLAEYQQWIETISLTASGVTETSDGRETSERALSPLESCLPLNGIVYLSLQTSNAEEPVNSNLSWSARYILIDYWRQRISIHNQSISSRPDIVLYCGHGSASIHDDMDHISSSDRNILSILEQDIDQFQIHLDGLIEERTSLQRGQRGPPNKPEKTLKLSLRCQTRQEYCRWRIVLTSLLPFYRPKYSESIAKKTTSINSISFPSDPASYRFQQENTIMPVYPSSLVYWSSELMIDEVMKLCQRLAQRDLIKHGVAMHKITGYTLKSMHFHMIQSSGSIETSSIDRIPSYERIICTHIPMDSNHEEILPFDEGSSVFSVNGISSNSRTSDSGLLTHLTDLPINMDVELGVLKYPRDEYCYQLSIYCMNIPSIAIKSSPSTASQDNSIGVSDGAMVASTAVAAAAATAAATLSKNVKFEDQSTPSINLNPLASNEGVVPVRRLSIAEAISTIEAKQSMPSTYERDPFGKDVLMAGSLRLQRGLIVVQCSDDHKEASIAVPITRTNTRVFATPPTMTLSVNSKSIAAAKPIGHLSIELTYISPQDAVSLSPSDEGNDSLKQFIDKSRSSNDNERMNGLTKILIVPSDLMTCIDILSSIIRGYMVVGAVPVNLADIIYLSNRLNSSQRLAERRMVRNLSMDRLSTDNNSSRDGAARTIETPRDVSSAQYDLMMAAEALDKLMQSLDLPQIFPTVTMISDLLRELKYMNSRNHLKLSEILQIQDNVKRIALGASSATNKAVYTTTTPSRNVLADKPRAVDISIISDIHKDILRRRVNSYGEDPLESSTNPSNSMSVSVEPAMGSTETANPSTLSAASTSAAMDPITPTSRSQSRSNSLSMKTAGVAVVASNPFNVSTESKTETSSSSSAAATSSQYQALNKPIHGLTDLERKWLFVLLQHLKNSPQAIVSVMNSMDVKIQLEFARILVTRVFCPYSCDQRPLISILHYLLWDCDTIKRFSSSKTPTQSSIDVFYVFLETIYHRYDVEAFLVQLFDDLITPTHIFHDISHSVRMNDLTNVTVHDICSRVIEPFLHRLMKALAARTVPPILQGLFSIVGSFSPSLRSTTSIKADICIEDILLELCKRGISRCVQRHSLRVRLCRHRLAHSKATTNPPSNPSQSQANAQNNRSISPRNSTSPHRQGNLSQSDEKRPQIIKTAPSTAKPANLRIINGKGSNAANPQQQVKGTASNRVKGLSNTFPNNRDRTYSAASSNTLATMIGPPSENDDEDDDVKDLFDSNEQDAGYYLIDDDSMSKGGVEANKSIKSPQKNDLLGMAEDQEEFAISSSSMPYLDSLHINLSMKSFGQGLNPANLSAFIASSIYSNEVEEIFIVLVQKIFDLIQLALFKDIMRDRNMSNDIRSHQDPQEKHRLMLKQIDLCLSDAAAMNRSIAIASKISQYIKDAFITPTSSLSSSYRYSSKDKALNDSSWSPIACITQFDPLSTRPLLCNDIACLLNDEAMYLINHVLLNNDACTSLIESYALHPLPPPLANTYETLNHSIRSMGLNHGNKGQGYAPSHTNSYKKDFFDAISYIKNASPLHLRLKSMSSMQTKAGRGSSMDSFREDSPSIVMIYSEYSFHIPKDSDNLFSSPQQLSESLIGQQDVIITADDVHVPGVNDMMALNWLISSCQTSLRNVYRSNTDSKARDVRMDSVTAIETKTRELKSLFDHLMAKRSNIVALLADMNRMNRCREYYANIQQQLSLFHVYLSQYHAMRVSTDSSASSSHPHTRHHSQAPGAATTSPTLTMAGIISQQFEIENSLSQMSSRYQRTATSIDQATKTSDKKSPTKSTGSNQSPVIYGIRGNPLSLSIATIRSQSGSSTNTPVRRGLDLSPQPKNLFQNNSNPLQRVMKQVFPLSSSSNSFASHSVNGANGSANINSKLQSMANAGARDLTLSMLGGPGI